MAEKWITPKEIAQMTGYTEQSINQRAAKEKWRKQPRPGIQGGKAHEFAFESVETFLTEAKRIKEDPEEYSVPIANPKEIWTATFQRLTKKERVQITHFILREGISGLLARLGLMENPSGNNKASKD